MQFYFSDYIEHPVKAINPKLLWEYDLDNFDYQDMRTVVVQRVVERGWPDDFYFILNRYGLGGVIQAMKEIPYLNDKDLNFLNKVFRIPLKELLCYQNKISGKMNGSF